MNKNTSPLGKGLSSLLSEDMLKDSKEFYIPDLDIKKIVPNPKQPRLDISPESLIELADSIREHGVIEPLIVSKRDDKYMLVAGERRWRAAQLGNIDTLPVVVKETSPQQMLEMAIVENIQRKDLNALEEALAYKQLRDEFKISVPEISKKVGLSRSAVANKIRLLQLPHAIRDSLINEEISEGHARALLGIPDDSMMISAMKMVIQKNLSVRATEELVRKITSEVKKSRNKNTDTSKIWSPRAVEIKNSLVKNFDKRVKLTRSRRGGKIIIPFKNDEELEDIYAKIVRQ